MKVDHSLIALAAGGTGGHLFPAQALAEELKRRNKNVILVTDKRGDRYAENFPCDEKILVSAASSVVGGPVAMGVAGVSILGGTFSALRTFRARGVQAVIGFGGYPSLPAMIAARLLKIPYGLHEQNGVLGRTNRLLAGGAKFVAHAFPVIERVPSKAKEKIIEIGNPLRDAVGKLAGSSYSVIGPQDDIRLLVFGGSQGASILSSVVPAAIARLPENSRRRISVIQQARASEADQVKSVYKAAEVNAEVEPFFDDLPEKIASSHLVISRAGASTVTEIATIGRPSILVPLGIAMDDHQTGNAKTLSEVDASILLNEADFTVDRLTSELEALFSDTPRLAKMASLTDSRVKLGASTMLADLTCDLTDEKIVL